MNGERTRQSSEKSAGGYLLTESLENLYSFQAYRNLGGYQAVEKALQMPPQEILAEVKRAGLRGRGGAGFPAGLKWAFIPQSAGKPVYLCVNADEGEPGAFKDRYLMTHHPHLLIEGIIIVAYTVGLEKCFIYIRGEYEAAAERLTQALHEAHAAGFLGRRILGKDFDLEVVIHKGAGAYICGEETALLESLEGKRGEPRLKPPFPASVGLFGRPTVINNVETLCHIPHIVLSGAERFIEAGLPADGGTRLFSVSGAVCKPGVYELPPGTELKALIYEHAGGLSEGKALKAVIPGGLSAPILRPDEIDIPLACDILAEVGSSMGTAAVIVISDETPILDVLKIMARFYAHESCGQCTPCRIGTSWIQKIAVRIASGKGESTDVDEIVRLATAMKGRTLCPMGDAAALAIAALVSKFRSELEGCLERNS